MTPISEAPKDGTWIIGIRPDSREWKNPLSVIVRWKEDSWRTHEFERISSITHFLPYNPPKPKRKIKLRGSYLIDEDGYILGSQSNRFEKAKVNLSTYNIEVEEGEGL